MNITEWKNGIFWQIKSLYDYVIVESVLEQVDILDIIPFELPDFNSAYSEKVDEKPSLENNLIVSKEKFNDKNRIPILSPGPREAELSSDTDDMDNVIFTKQAYNGLLIRMSLLYYFLHWLIAIYKMNTLYKSTTHNS